MALRVERNHYHGATPGVERDAGGRIRHSRFVEVHTEVDRETADCCSQCCTALCCSPTRTTSQKVAKVGVYALSGVGIGDLAGTYVFPGLGTAGGAAIGGVVGAGIGIAVVLSEDSK